MPKAEMAKTTRAKDKYKLNMNSAGVNKMVGKKRTITKDQEVIEVEEEAKTLAEWWQRTTAVVMETIAREEWKEMPGWEEEQEQEMKRAIMEKKVKKNRNIKKKPASNT